MKANGNRQKFNFSIFRDIAAPNGFHNVIYDWEDVTTEFLQSVTGNLRKDSFIHFHKITFQLADLELGELLHDELFGLFEAMSAIEMMDPKMDAGMLCNRGVKKAKSFDQAIDVGTEKKCVNKMT